MPNYRDLRFSRRVGFGRFGLFCGFIFVGRFRFRVFYFAIAGGEPGADLLWIVAERAHAAAVGDAGRFVNDVKALGPGGVGVVGSVGHVVDAERERKLETFGEIITNGEALLESRGLGVADVFLEVGLHLPFVGGVRFTNIDSQKIGVLLVIVEDLDDVADLATEGRSSKTTEDEDEWFGAGAFANMKVVGAVEREEASVGSRVADL